MSLPAFSHAPTPHAAARMVGAGIVCGAGRGLDAFWQALCAADPLQRSASLGDPRIDATYVRVPCEREAGDDDLASHWLTLACEDALAAAQTTLSQLGPQPRIALLAGTSLGGMTIIERLQRRAWDAQRSHGSGLYCPDLPAERGLYHGPATHVGARVKSLIGSLTINTACSSAAHALGIARRWLNHGRIDAAVVAGYDVISPFAYAGFRSLGAIDTASCAPFAKERHGLNLGEAAAAIVLVRSRDTATDDDAIDLVGYGASCDAYHVTRPDPSGSGLARAIQRALTDAQFAPHQVAVVCAHATGTAANDAMESAALTSVFCHHQPLVYCAKPVTGHTLGAAAMINVLAMMLALRTGHLPRTHTRGQPDPTLAFHASDAEHPLTHATIALTTASGFGGSNAALLLARGAV